MFSRLLFETPWWLPTVAIGIGIFVWLTGNRRLEKRVMLTGLGIAALGVAILMISIAVDTDRERTVKRTRQLVASAAQHDWTKFESLLDPETNIYGLRGPQQITQAARSAADSLNLTAARITGMTVDQADTVITISMRVYSEQFRGNPGMSDWQLQYQNYGQGFVLYSVRAVSSGVVNEELIRGRLQRYLSQQQQQ